MVTNLNKLKFQQTIKEDIPISGIGLHTGVFSKIVIKVVLFPTLVLISCVWRLLHRRRVIYGKYEKMPIPVVCIGNVTLGGAGKTPTVIFLVDYLIKNKIKVFLIKMYRSSGTSRSGFPQWNSFVEAL